MWQADNITPFMAKGSWTRERDGGEIRLIAVRCAFHIHLV